MKKYSLVYGQMDSNKACKNIVYLNPSNYFKLKFGK